MNDLKSMMAYSLDDSEVRKYAKKLGYDCKVVSYDKIHKYKTLDQLLGKDGCVVILYLTSEHYGHYVLVFKRGKTIEFYDPYGIGVDNEFTFIPKEFQGESNQDYPYLTQLLYNSGYKIHRNQYRLQKGKNGVNCCGRHALVRLLFRNLNEDQYKDLLKTLSKKFKTNADGIVTLMTRDIKMKPRI